MTCESGPGSYTSLYEAGRLPFVDPDGDVPTWFSSSNSLYSIFGGSSQSVPVDEGTTAYFDPVTDDEPVWVPVASQERQRRAAEEVTRACKWGFSRATLPARREEQMNVFEVPVDWSMGALYSWTLRLSDKTVQGHIVLRGGGAGAIGEWGYEKGTETWYYATPTSASNQTPQFTLKLLMMTQGTDEELIAAVGEVRENETDFGVLNVIPSWEQGAPLPSTPKVFTMTDVENGSGSYGSLYNKVSLVLPLVNGVPVLPTFYTSDSSLTSILGNNPAEVGIEVFFTETDDGKPGFPNEDWYWYGRDPS